MKITLCGSINFVEEILEIKNKLVRMGHEVFVPKSIIDFSIKNSEEAEKLKTDKKRYIEEIKPTYTTNHFELIEKSDAILVVNLEKNNIKNYIGGATFAEMMVAFYLGKKIFLLNPIPQDERLKFIVDEMEAIKPIILNGKIDEKNISVSKKEK